MEMTFYVLLDILLKLASNHNETFVNDEVDLNLEQPEEV